MQIRKTGLIGLGAAASTLAIAQAAFAETADTKRGAAVSEIVVTARRSAENLQEVPIAVTAVNQQQMRDLTVRDVMDIQKLAPGLYMNTQGNAGRAKVTIRGQSEQDSTLSTDPSVGVYVDGVNLPRSLGLRTAFLDIAQVEVLKGPQGTLYGRNTTGGALNITTRQPTFEPGGYLDVLAGNYENRQIILAANLPLIADKLAIRAVGQSISRAGFGHDALGGPRGDDHVTTGRIELLYEPTARIRVLLSADYASQRNGFNPTQARFNNMAACCNSATSSLGEIAAELGLNPNSTADRATALAAWNAQYNAYFNGSIGPFDSLSTFRSHDNFDLGGASANLEADLGWAKVRSITAYRQMDRDTLQDLDGATFHIVEPDLKSKDYNLSQELQLSAIRADGVGWQAGLYFNNEHGVDGGDNESNPLVAVIPGTVAGGNPFAGQSPNVNVSRATIHNASYAAYGQAVIPLGRNVRFTGGLRYTYEYRGMDNQSQFDRTRAEPGLTPQPFITPGNCLLLAPQYGGPTWPDCHKKVSTTSNALTYLASLDWKPSDDVMAYASVSRGFRAGGWTIRANTNLITGPTQASALALEAAIFKPFQPEFVNSFELGLKSELFDHRLRLNAAAYFQKYDDIQVAVRIQDGTAFANRIVNAAQGTIYGGEVEATAQLTERLQVDGGFAYMHARYDRFTDVLASGATIDRSSQAFPAPKWTYRLGAHYTAPLRDGELRFAANYNRVDDVNYKPDVTLTPAQAAAITQTAFGLLDARISWKIESQGLEISLWGRNLTDKRYITSVQQTLGVGIVLGYVGDPRTFGLQIRKTWGGG